MVRVHRIFSKTSSSKDRTQYSKIKVEFRRLIITEKHFIKFLQQIYRKVYFNGSHILFLSSLETPLEELFKRAMQNNERGLNLELMTQNVKDGEKMGRLMAHKTKMIMEAGKTLGLNNVKSNFKSGHLLLDIFFDPKIMEKIYEKKMILGGTYDDDDFFLFDWKRSVKYKTVIKVRHLDLKTLHSLFRYINIYKVAIHINRYNLIDGQVAPRSDWCSYSSAIVYESPETIDEAFNSTRNRGGSCLILKSMLI